MIIDTESIYSVDPHERAIVPRYGAIELDEYEAGVMVNTIEEPISIEGVQESDLVIFGCADFRAKRTDGDIRICDGESGTTNTTVGSKIRTTRR